MAGIKILLMFVCLFLTILSLLYYQGYKSKILSGEATLEGLAETESDCSSARKGGDLGFFTRGKMQSK